MNGNLDQCRLIMDNINEWNSEDSIANTPFTMAVANGHLEVCRMILNR